MEKVETEDNCIQQKTFSQIRTLNTFCRKREVKGKKGQEERNLKSELSIKNSDGMPPATGKTDAVGKKLEINAFQIECETDIQWRKLLKREGLIVVDVYASWAGPCISMVNILKRIKMEINDPRLWYGLAKSDDIIDLHMFQDQSEPTWLFIGGGKPVKVFRGCNVTILTSLIKSEFEHELNCITGKARRNLISIDDEVSRRRKAEAEAEKLMQFMKDEDKTAEEINFVRKESSVRLMKSLEVYSVLVVQNYLLETGALTEIRDELFGEFKIEQERTVKLDEKGVRELFRIPYAIVDPNQSPQELLLASKLPPLEAEAPAAESDSEGETNADAVQVSEEARKPIIDTSKIKKIPIPLPDGLLGDTHIMLLQALDLKKMMSQGKKPSPSSLLQTADDYLLMKVGPLQYKDAMERAPYSFHAVYGKGENVPGVWCPRRYDDKRYVMINFFPRFVTEMLMPPPDHGAPKYMVALFPTDKIGDVKLGTEFHRQDVFASGNMQVPPEVVEEMLETWGIVKGSEAYKKKKEQLSGDVYAVSINTTNSRLGLTIKSLDPLHMSFDKTSGMVESAKLFSQLEIKLDNIPNVDDVVSKFLGRAKKRPTSITELAKVAISQAASRVPSGSELKATPYEQDDDDWGDENKEDGPMTSIEEKEDLPKELGENNDVKRTSNEESIGSNEAEVEDVTEIEEQEEEE